jgi:hypothetical protein
MGLAKPLKRIVMAGRIIVFALANYLLRFAVSVSEDGIALYSAISSIPGMLVAIILLFITVNLKPSLLAATISGFASAIVLSAALAALYFNFYIELRAEGIAIVHQGFITVPGIVYIARAGLIDGSITGITTYVYRIVFVPR